MEKLFFIQPLKMTMDSIGETETYWNFWGILQDSFRIFRVLKEKNFAIFEGIRNIFS